MPKNKLKRFEGLGSMILKLIKKHKQMTTFAIKRQITGQEVDVTWKTIKRYLEDLEKEKKVTYTVFNDNKLVVWSLP